MNATPVAPQNLAAEESVLGAIMLAGTHGVETSAKVVAATRATGLKPDDFYRESHALVYGVALVVAERGQPTDVLALENELCARGRLAAAGGTARLAELAHLVTATANAGHFAALVVEAAERREQVGAALALLAAAENGGLRADDGLREQVARLLAPRGASGAEQIEFVTFEAFVARREPQAKPLALDADGGTVVSAAGLGMVYGTGGAGKTTLWLDAAMHFAAGIPWLGGAVVPVRKLRVAWIENEGPREEFRRKLERKVALWRGRVKRERLRVLDQPWSRYDLRRADHREALARVVSEAHVDLLIVGPLHRLGMEGGGTPDEVRAFVSLIEDVQRRAERPIFFLIVHHDNRAGQVSGAWEGVPDLLVHVTPQGNGRTRVYWQKARWSSLLHATAVNLTWTEGEGFARAEAEPDRPERTWDDMASYVLENGGCSWSPVEKTVTGSGPYLRRRRDQMLADGILVNAGRGQAFELWHRDDPARPTLDSATVSEEGRGVDAVASAPGDEGLHRTVSTVSPRKGDTVRDAVGSVSPAEPEHHDAATGGKGGMT